MPNCCCSVYSLNHCLNTCELHVTCVKCKWRFSLRVRLTVSSRHCAGGVPLWQFIDFVVTHPTPLFMMLLPFIKYKVSQKCVLGGFLGICTSTNISKTTKDCVALQLSVIVPCGRRACR